MNTLTTSGVQISVKISFRQDISEVLKSNYFYSYSVKIQNMNSYPIQLQFRDWYIFDSLNEDRYISGSGVIGEQPILKPSETFMYSSGCDLQSEIGMMRGFYTFINLSNGELFEVIVPTFKLEYPPKLN